MTETRAEVGDPTPTLTGTRSERRDAAEHRRQILTSARMLFAERGIESVSMHQIAQAAGVGQGTLYRRYGHKGELCFDLLRESGERFWREIEAYLEAGQENGPPLERLDGLVGRALRFIEDKAQLLSAIDDACLGAHRDLQFGNPFYRWIHDRVAMLLREAIDAGDLAELDVTFTADALLAAISVDLYLFQRRERGFSLEQIHEAVRRLFLRSGSATTDGVGSQ